LVKVYKIGFFDGSVVNIIVKLILKKITINRF